MSHVTPTGVDAIFHFIRQVPVRIPALMLLMQLSVLSAEDLSVSALNADQKNALEAITQRRILGTVSFLASDEMAGRDTPSKELTIATSFVAARFREAGLEAIGDSGTYFQSHSFETVQPPDQSALLLIDDKKSFHRLPVIAATDEAISISDTVYTEAQALTGGAAIALLQDVKLPPQAAARPASAVAFLARRIRPLTEKGVKVVLLACEADSVLREIADALKERPLRASRVVTAPCPIVLVPNDTDLESKSVSVDVAAQRKTENAVSNVIGLLRGSDDDLAEEAIIISAHLDHIGIKATGTDRINNGADDNATGVTTVLALADAFAALKSRPKRSILFVTFWGEEKGLLGSREFVRKPLWPLEKIVANINIEMVGRPEKDAVGKAWMTGWKHSNLGDVMNAGSQRVGVEIFNRTDVGEMLYQRSDNYAFVEHDVIAHSFSAGSLHSDYHQPSDEWQKLDLNHMTKVIRGLYAGAIVVADNLLKVHATETD